METRTITIGETYDIATKSYEGSALCLKLMDNGDIAFAINNVQVLLVPPKAVIDKSNTKKKLKKIVVDAMLKRL